MMVIQGFQLTKRSQSKQWPARSTYAVRVRRGAATGKGMSIWMDLDLDLDLVLWVRRTRAMDRPGQRREGEERRLP